MTYVMHSFEHQKSLQRTNEYSLVFASLSRSHVSCTYFVHVSALMSDEDQFRLKSVYCIFLGPWSPDRPLSSIFGIINFLLHEIMSVEYFKQWAVSNFSARASKMMPCESSSLSVKTGRKEKKEKRPNSSTLHVSSLSTV